MMGGGKGELKTTYKPYYVDTMCKKVIIIFAGSSYSEKYNIIEAENGEACLTKLYERNYDIVMVVMTILLSHF